MIIRQLCALQHSALENLMIHPKNLIPTSTLYGGLFKFQRHFHHAPHKKLPKTPDLIYVPQIMKWLKNKFKFKLLKNAWDPEFSEGAFIYGTTKAICKITEIISRDQPQEFENLLTFSAKLKLVKDMATHLTQVQKDIITLRPEDIKILVPLEVALNKNRNKKDCKISLSVLGLKWYERSNTLKLVVVALQTEFLRDYTNGYKNSEWTISAFDVLECGILRQIPS